MLDGILLMVTTVSQMAQDTSWGGRRVGELDQMTKPCLEKHHSGHIPMGSHTSSVTEAQQSGRHKGVKRVRVCWEQVGTPWSS